MFYDKKKKAYSRHVHKLMFVMVFVMMVGGLAAQVAGDYMAQGLGIKIETLKYYNGTKWLSKGEVGYMDFPDDLKFGMTLYIEQNSTFEVYEDIVLEGDGIIEVKSGGSLWLGSSNQTLTVEPGASINLGGSITISKNSTLINRGEILSTSGHGNITLAGGSSNDYATLKNYNLIELNNGDAKIDFGSSALFVSGENGQITGSANCNTGYDTHFEIANPNGLDGANQLTGTHTCHNNGMNITFNGTQPQKTGSSLPVPLIKVVFNNPYGVELETDLTISVNGGSVTVKGGSDEEEDGTSLDVGNYIIKTDNLNWGYATFYLEENATLITQNPNGISSQKTGAYISSGSIQLNNAYYSSGANYTYNRGAIKEDLDEDEIDENGRVVQNSGIFDTYNDISYFQDPNSSGNPPSPHTNPVKVNKITVRDDTCLVLEQNFLAPGGKYEEYNGVFCYGEGDDGFSITLPVTLANLYAMQTPSGLPQLLWHTASETNCMGFYVWRADELDLGVAIRVSGLIEAVNTSQGAAYAWTDEEVFEEGLYYYWLEDVSFDQQTAFHGPASIHVIFTGQHQAPEIIQSTGIKTGYPNPFNPSVTLSYYLEQSAPLVKIEFFNLKGQLVDALRIENKDKGLHRVVWNAEHKNLPSGVYFARFSSGRHQNTLRLVLAK